MYTENEGPRSNQEGFDNLDAQTSPNQSVQELERQDAGLSDEQGNNDALTTRTPERWWLRKRLMQG
jgi:hypothetical protein